jgi:hypothetical protein
MERWVVGRCRVDVWRRKAIDQGTGTGGMGLPGGRKEGGEVVFGSVQRKESGLGCLLQTWQHEMVVSLGFWIHLGLSANGGKEEEEGKRR